MGGCTQNFDDFNQLVNRRVSREKRTTKHQLCHHTSGGPDVYFERYLLKLVLTKKGQQPGEKKTNGTGIVGGPKN